MDKIRTFSLIILVLISISCLGDGAARIKGQIVFENEVNDNKCYLEVYLKNDRRLIHSIQIKNTFDKAFTISPSNKDYYISVRCEGYERIFEKCCYTMGGKKFMKNPIELGKIVLK